MHSGFFSLSMKISVNYRAYNRKYRYTFHICQPERQYFVVLRDSLNVFHKCVTEVCYLV
jgi:hypothetical protein